MKIFLTSDLHTEKAQKTFDPHYDYGCLQFNYPEDADVIVLAGDVGERVNGLEWARNRFKDKPIVYVPGNHEYYDSDLSIIDELRNKAMELDVFLLDNEAVTIDGVRFLGTTLWTDLNRYSPEVVDHAWHEINDYRYIKCEQWWKNQCNRNKAFWLMDAENQFEFDPTYLSPTVSYLLHRQSIAWLGNSLNQPHAGKTIVVTHHAPTMRYTQNHNYGSDLEKFIAKRAKQIDLWCHGHLHNPVDYEVSGVRVTSNPRGYPKFNVSEKFREDKILLI